MSASRQYFAGVHGPGIDRSAMVENDVGIIPRAMMRRVGPLGADDEELARLVALDQQELLEQPTAPRPLVIGGRRHRHVVVDPVMLALVRMVAVIAQRGDDQRQAFRALAA